jgi:hypothetical protein
MPDDVRVAGDLGVLSLYEGSSAVERASCTATSWRACTAAASGIAF